MSSRLTRGSGTPSRRSRLVRLVLAVAALAAIAAPATAATQDPPFPLGVCVRATVVDPRPVCVMVDPSE